MSSKPENLLYGVDDKPHWKVSFLLGLQHVFTMSSTLVLPVVIGREIGADIYMIQALVCFSMISAGIGTITQAINKGPIGSGYLCPNLVGPSYLAVSIQAAYLGGIPLMRGMTVIAGLFEVAFSQVVTKLRSFFPSEITGLVVLMIGVSLIPIGTSKFIGISYQGDAINYISLIISSVTLFTMIGLNIWGKGKIKLYSLLIGLAIGYVLSIITGVISQKDLAIFINAPLFEIPGKGIRFFHFQFNWSLLIPFLIVSLSQSLKSFGNLITCQKINDKHWRTPDMKKISKGLFADGLSVATAGFLGGVATDSSASNVGLSLATSATSRIIAYFAGIIFIVIAFMPKGTAFFSIMPDPLMGAILIFVTCFMLISGFQIILLSHMDVRKIFIIGLSFLFGLSAIILPDLYVGVPAWLSPIFSSSLTLSTMFALLLNQVLGKRSVKSNA